MNALIFTLLTGCLSSVRAAYTLQAEYNALNWMSAFTAQQEADPTGGYVTYVSQQQAQSEGIYKIVDNKIFIGVDNSTVLDPNGAGRSSLRLSSNQAFTQGLFIADFDHIPGSECGSWPAYWMVGPNWPANGEIDIIEGINDQTSNAVTLHSASGCSVDVGSGGQTGSPGYTNNCNANNAGDGCSVYASNNAASYGSPFNAAGGGVYALQWTGQSVAVWLFRHGSVPPDVQAGVAPDPSSWGTPLANFAGCDFDKYFANMNMLFDITFCGGWAGGQWGASCAGSTGQASCNAYVAANPQTYDETYWLINSVKVYGDELLGLVPLPI